jgi:hypothetical protein
MTLGADLGKHRSPMLRNHRARIRFERYNRLRLSLNVFRYGRLTPHQMKVHIRDPALAETSKKSRYEGSTNGVVFDLVVLVAHVPDC